jgi:hypothetical protein
MSEAVMVSPEQCETAPKSMVKALHPARPSPQTSSSRLVLLAVLALAAATGAMFGVVVFGNEFTKDMRPKGGDSVVLVDENDRAIATSDVESYVSILDMPLLGVSELNKVDGITYSTHEGLEHRKITGYMLTDESVSAGDLVASAPRLSLSTSVPEVTIEVSTRDASAWVYEKTSSGFVKTPVLIGSNRRLSDGSGSCLSNGACLYSNDEILQLDAEGRRLTDGSFFARADVAAYQVEFEAAATTQYIARKETNSYFHGVYVEDGHEIAIHAQTGADATQILVSNRSTSTAKLINRNGTFVFEAGHLYECDRSRSSVMKALLSMNLDELSKAKDYIKSEVTHGAQLREFIPSAFTETTADDCQTLTITHGNLTDPVGMAFWSGEMIKNQPTSHRGNWLRKLGSVPDDTQTWEYKMKMNVKEAQALMSDKNNDINRRRANAKAKMLGLTQDERKLDEIYYNDDGDIIYFEDYMMSNSTFHPYSYITHFELWVATRMADPLFVYDYSFMNNGESWVSPYADAALNTDWGGLNNEFIGYLSGGGGVGIQFQRWTGFTPAQQPVYNTDGNLVSTAVYFNKLLWDLDIDAGPADDKEAGVYSQAVWSTLLPGTCAGGFVDGGGVDPPYDAVDLMCYPIMYGSRNMDLRFLNTDFLDSFGYSNGYFLPSSLRRNLEGKTQPFIGETRQRIKPPSMQGKERKPRPSEITKREGETAGSLRIREKHHRQLASMTDAVLKDIEDGVFTYCNTVDDISFTGDSKSSEDDIKNLFKGQKWQVGLGNAFATYLEKDVGGYIEYVIAFQGTKAEDKTMYKYNTDQKPMYVMLGGVPAILPRGQLDYMSSLMPCMKQYWRSNWMMTGAEPSFVTGHSLGGAAATLFHKSEAAWSNMQIRGEEGFDMDMFPRLVTFGAAPTAYRGSGTPEVVIACYPDDEMEDSENWFDVTIKCDGTPENLWSLKKGAYTYPTMSSDDYTTFSALGFASACDPDNYSPQGVRFFHKFDPIASVATWKGTYAHSVANAIMLWDEYDTSCSWGSEESCMATSNPEYFDSMTAHPNEITNYLCSGFNVQPWAMPTVCTDYLSSYMTLFNPLPCGQIGFQIMFSELPDMLLGKDSDFLENAHIGYATVNNLQRNLFVPFEDFIDCSIGWLATLKAYYRAAVLDAPHLFGILMTFTWTHSTYGNYPLCIETGDSGEIQAYGGDFSDLDIGLNSDGAASQSDIDYCYTTYSNWWDQDMCICEASGVYGSGGCERRFG